MLKLLGAFIMAATLFGLGFYLGQRPVGTLQHKVLDLQRSITTLSRNIYDTTMGDLRKRQALIDGKSRVVQAKSELLEKNFGEAAKQLGAAADTLEEATAGAKHDETSLPLKSLAGKIREIKREMSMRKLVSMKKIDEIEREIDRQINR